VARHQQTSNSTCLKYKLVVGKKRGSFKWKSKIARAISAVNILASAAFLTILRFCSFYSFWCERTVTVNEDNVFIKILNLMKSEYM
jgi:hypothetical protein